MELNIKQEITSRLLEERINCLDLYPKLGATRSPRKPEPGPLPIWAEKHWYSCLERPTESPPLEYYATVWPHSPFPQSIPKPAPGSKA